MYTLRKGLPLVAGAALLLSAGSASAQIALNDWILDLSPAGGTFVGHKTLGVAMTGVDQATFFSPTRVITDISGGADPNALDIGDTQTAVGIGSITGFVNSANQTFTQTTCTTCMVGNTSKSLGIIGDFEVTFTFTLNEVITSVLGDDVDFAHTGGNLDLYVDTSPDFNGSLGTGADDDGGLDTDATKIASFVVVPGIGGGNLDLVPGAGFDGNVDVVFRATDVEPGWLFLNDMMTDIADIVDGNDDPILIALSNSNFDLCAEPAVDPTAGCAPAEFVEGGAFDALGTPYPDLFNPNDFFVDEDGSIDLAVLPEPGTLAVFGLGLMGLGLAVRRRRVIA